MSDIRDLGRRIELISRDPHFQEISIGLYRQEGNPARFLVHSYSTKQGASEHIAKIRQGMVVLGGMTEEDGYLSFPCGYDHLSAVRRVFLESGKFATDVAEVRPLQTLDKKSGLTIQVTGLGDGVYEVSAEGDGKSPERRIKVVANGIAKLGETIFVDGQEDQVQFPCRQAHDALTGLLLVRAPNVRALVREEELVAARGVLAAPSQQ